MPTAHRFTGQMLFLTAIKCQGKFNIIISYSLRMINDHQRIDFQIL